MWCVISEVAEVNIYMYLRTCHLWLDSRNCFQMVQTLRSLYKLNFLSQVTKGMLVLLDSMDGIEIQVSVMFLRYNCVGETIIMLKTKKTKQCSLYLYFFTINMFMKSMDIFIFLFESLTLLISSGSGWPYMIFKRELAYYICCLFQMIFMKTIVFGKCFLVHRNEF